MRPTTDQAQAYEYAFDYLNRTLFDDELTRPMLMLTRNAKTLGGYYSPDRWENEDGEKVGELSLNVNLMADGDLINFLGILVHEMSHVWQDQLGSPGRAGYHNTEWAEKVKALGLDITNSDGKNGTGQAVGTKVSDTGPAALAIAGIDFDLLFPWQGAELQVDDPKDDPTPGGAPTPPAPKKGSRTKFTCPCCFQNAWAKHSASLVCGEDGEVMIAQV